VSGRAVRTNIFGVLRKSLPLLRVEHELGPDSLKPLGGARQRRRTLNTDPQGPGDKTQIERQGKRQRHPQQRVSCDAARRRRRNGHVRRTSPRSRRKPLPGSKSSGKRLVSLEETGPLSARDASLPMAKPSQLAIAIAAARLPH